MSEPQELASDLRVVIGQLIRRLRAERRALPMNQLAVLGRLDRTGPAGVSDLAAGERVRPQSMASTVHTLERAGLVHGRPDPTDGRRRLIDMTAAGRAMLADDRARRVGWLADTISRDLTPHEQRVLADAVELLSRIAAGEG